MRVLLTGATGLIGKKLIEQLVQHQYEVLFLTTSRQKIKHFEKAQGYYWNPKEGILDEACIEGVDAIIHLAGASISKRWTKKYRQEIVESRVHSLSLLFELLQKKPNQVKHLISASGIACYPNSLVAVYDEESPERSNDFLGNVVQQWEHAALQFQSLSLSVTLVRTGVVLSKEGGVLEAMTAPIKKYVGACFGSGKQIQSWIHIEDLVNLYRFVLEKKIQGVVHAVAPQSNTNAEMTRMISNILKKTIMLPNIPQFVMQAVLGEMSSLLFDSKKVLPKRALTNGFLFQFDTLEKALQDVL
ncbi:TIGR01777 family oxidoreductase [Flavobacterium aciduliphilum]|uniref:TIGR01777 family protein n=1 Tax=Flavobacterium aciduliphilum TaxID=1101402 RepID=A0A328YNP6_9FLAO|nr:TIGR01777 family oxidoreductase [Flavobacterium aciduliphilum]RAR75479.1 hypothetical protein CLV55_101176 [Flavobacterium aciduliphilum]